MTHEFRPRQVLIRARDMPAALAFYRDVLGLKVAFQDGERYVAFESTSISLALAGEEETTDPVVVAYRVLDVPGAAEELVAGGAAVVREPSRTAHEERATLADPSGAPISLYAPVKAPEASG